jgi:lupus La protein
MFIFRKIINIFAKSDAKRELTPRLCKIKEQMEFYLSPSNVESSAFMKELVKERDDRFCRLETFATKFNRLKEMEATVEELVEACSESADLELDATKTLVRTVVPFKRDPRRDFRTVHVEGFNEDETLESLQSIFRDIFGKVLRVEMRWRNRHGGERYFSGEVNVEVESEEIAENAVKEGNKFNNENLKVQLLSEFNRELKSRAVRSIERRAERRVPRKSGKNE